VNGVNIGGDYEIGCSVSVCVSVVVSVCVSVYPMTNNNSNDVISPTASSSAGCYIILPPLQQSGSSFCLPFPCVCITLLGRDMQFALSRMPSSLRMFLIVLV